MPHVPWRHHGGGEVYGDIGLPGYFEMWRNDIDLARFAQHGHTGGRIIAAEEPLNPDFPWTLDLRTPDSGEST